MEKLTELKMNEDGCIYKMDKGYIVVVFACRGGTDTLYFTSSYKEAMEKLGLEEPEESIQITLQEGDKMFDLMGKYATLTYPILKKLMSEQGFVFDKSYKLVKEV